MGVWRGGTEGAQRGHRAGGQGVLDGGRSHKVVNGGDQMFRHDEGYPV